MDFDEIRKRLEAVSRVRAQRQAAERRIPGERLSRKLRERFAQQPASEHGERREAGGQPDQSADRKP